jgi:VWFA-related protein
MMFHDLGIARRWMLGSAAAVVAVVVTAAAPAGRQADPREQHVFATVVDKQGGAIKGLTASDFSVKEDGQAREILRAEPSVKPMQIALLVDTSQAVQPNIQDLRRALATFINNIYDANSDNQVALYTFGERSALKQTLTSSRVLVLKAAGAVFPIQGSGAYFHDAVRDAATDLKKAGAPHPVLVGFVSERSPEFSTYDHIRVAEFLQAANASLWTITLQGRNLNGPPLGREVEAQGQERSQVLDDVTVQSGGTNEPVLTSTALETTFARIALLLSTSYDITYSRPEALIPPKKREVRLTDKPDLKLMAPRWGGK